MACATSAMPGPWSRATTQRPCLLAWFIGRMMISPHSACSIMFRDTSEMAAAISVSSALSKPSSMPMERPCWRAVTMSSADVIGIRVSRTMARFPVGLLVQIGQAFFEVQSRADSLQRQTELDHGKGHLGLDANDDGLSPAQFKHVRDGAQGARGKGINEVQHRHVDDHAARAVLANPFG